MKDGIRNFDQITEMYPCSSQTPRDSKHTCKGVWVTLSPCRVRGGQPWKKLVSQENDSLAENVS